MIIGAMKSGTTTLFDVLATHPQIEPSNPKEPEFFSENVQNKLEGVADYLSLWPQEAIAAGRYLLEGSTGYTKWPRTGDVTGRIRDYGLSPKFIYVVREPVSRIESHFNFALHKPWFDPRIPVTDDRYTDLSKYFMQLSNYQEAVRRGDLLIVDFDEIKNNLGSLLDRISVFLEIEGEFDLSNLSASNTTLTPTVAERFIYENRVLRTVLWAAPYRLRKPIQSLAMLAPGADKIRLSGAQKETIRAKLADDMHRFGQTYGFNVAKWGF